MKIAVLALCLACALAVPARAGVTLPKSAFPDAAWPGGIVPYSFDSAFLDIATVEAAITYYQSRTRVRFVKRRAEKDYVTFANSSGHSNYSDVGRLGGQQWVHLAPGCALDTVIHEIGHTLGLYHEQARNDRERFVKVHYENIPKDAHDEFDIEPEGLLLGDYDLHSIMHYGPFDFSKNGKPTITLPNGDTQGIAEGEGLSPGDLKAIEWLVGPHLAVTQAHEDEVTQAEGQGRGLSEYPHRDAEGLP